MWSKPLKDSFKWVSLSPYMRMLRSILLRLSLVITTTIVLCLFLMAVTLGFQELFGGMRLCLVLGSIGLVWLIVNFILQRKLDPELSVEAARIHYPSGAILSIVLSLLFSLQLDAMIPGTEGIEHYILLFVGLGVAAFMAVRSFDVKWLRLEEEILSVEERGE